MGKTTGIPWCRSTFNGWIGCMHASVESGGTNPLCDFCYAERENGHWEWNGGQWGPGAPRKLTAVHYWNDPFRWNREALHAKPSDSWPGPANFWPVFAFSLGDVFDEEGPEWPQERELPGGVGFLTSTAKIYARDVFFFEIVRRTPSLTWLILTKRYKACLNYLQCLWGENPWKNVWVIFSAGTQATLDEACKYLEHVPAVVRGISAEPLLETLDIHRYGFVDWWIAGGESGPISKTRLMPIDAERRLRQDSKRMVPGRPAAYFLKQLGVRLASAMKIPGAGGDPALWPEPMRVREFPL